MHEVLEQINVQPSFALASEVLFNQILLINLPFHAVVNCGVHRCKS